MYNASVAKRRKIDAVNIDKYIFSHSEIDATGPPPFERALKTDLVTMFKGRDIFRSSSNQYLKRW